VIFLVILVSYGAWIGLDPVIMRYSETQEGLAGRVAVWKDTVDLIKHFPTFGTGLGSYAISFTLFKNQASLPVTYSHAHNDYLELAAETGLIGFILVLFGLILIFRKSLVYVKTFPYRNDPLRYFLAIGCVSGIISMLIHAFTEFNFQIPANAYYFVFLLGLLTSIVYNQPRTNSY
jgi:putative inorganic carbon (HCO3(-)) transporter